MAKNTKNQRSNTASKSDASEKVKTYAERKKEKSEAVKTEFAGCYMHVCEIVGGRKFEHGTKVDCVWLGANRYLARSAMIYMEGKDEPDWIDPKFLKPVKALPAAKKARYEAEREAATGATVLLPATVGDENDKSVRLHYSGWFRGLYFPREEVSRAGTMQDGTEVFEVPAWVIKQRIGSDSLDMIQSKQKEIQADIDKAEAATAKKAA